jgi:hypothetical protein
VNKNLYTEELQNNRSLNQDIPVTRTCVICYSNVPATGVVQHGYQPVSDYVNAVPEFSSAYDYAILSTRT